MKVYHNDTILRDYNLFDKRTLVLQTLDMEE